MNDRLPGLWGLARRAGKVVFGLDAVLKAAGEGKIKLVFLAEDASERSKREAGRVCSEHEIPVIYTEYSMERMGSAIGRSNTAVLGFTDESFSNKAKVICHAN